MKSLFITATGTNVGKTYVTLKLIETFAAQGFRVGAFKPIETGVTEIAADATLLLEACQKVNPDFMPLSTKDITTYTFPLPAAPFCADTHQTIQIASILETYHKLSEYCDILLVEGAGGLLVPITQTFMMIDLIQTLKSHTLLVTPSRLGCINDTLLSIEALKSRNIHFDWCVNLYEEKESFQRVTQPYYDTVFKDWWAVNSHLKHYKPF